DAEITATEKRNIRMDLYEAETSYLGSILIEGSLIKDVEIDGNYFAYEAHQLIFQAMMEADKKKGAIDVVTVTTVLLERENLEAGDRLGEEKQTDVWLCKKKSEKTIDQNMEY